MPRVGAFEQFDELVGQPSRRQVGEGHHFEHATQCCTRCDPQFSRHVCRCREGEVFRGSAVHICERSVDGSNHVGDADVGGGFGQPVATIVTALARHQTRSAEISKQSFYIAKRDALAFRDHVALEALFGGENGQFEYGPNGVIDCSGHAHGWILARQPSMELPIVFPTD